MRPNLVAALQLAKQVGARVLGIVGKDGGYTAQVADACVIVPTVNPNNITPHSEAFQAVVWHLFVSHPDAEDEPDEVGKRREPRPKALTGCRAPRRDLQIRRTLLVAMTLISARGFSRSRRHAQRPGRARRQTLPAADRRRVRALPGRRGRMRALAAAGFVLVVATNQPDVGRGTQSQAVVEAMHAKLRALVRRSSGSKSVTIPAAARRRRRRKPAPGMLLDAARDARPRPGALLDGRRPLARHRLRPRAGRADGVHRFRLRRGAARAPGLHRRSPSPTPPAIILAHPDAENLNRSLQLIRMKSLNDLKIQIYADGADKAGILDLYAKPYIKGLTTNPRLMKKADQGLRGVRQGHPPDGHGQAHLARGLHRRLRRDARQALKITRWGKNVYTKIPITNSRGESCLPLDQGTRPAGREAQRHRAAHARSRSPASPRRSTRRSPSVVSVFAGRIADTGVDPDADHARLRCRCSTASPRPSCSGPARARCSIFSRPRNAAAQIITVPHDILAKAAKMVGHGSHGAVARHGEDVLEGRDGRRLHPLNRSEDLPSGGTNIRGTRRAAGESRRFRFTCPSRKG